MSNVTGAPMESLNLADAEETLRIAVGLGYTPPVFSGATIYIAWRLVEDDYCNDQEELIGVYSTKEKAEAKILNPKRQFVNVYRIDED